MAIGIGRSCWECLCSVVQEMFVLQSVSQSVRQAGNYFVYDITLCTSR